MAFPLVVAALLTFFVVECVIRLPASWARDWLGYDYRILMDATQGWMAHGAFYPPSELVASFHVGERDILYPPIALALFVPFTFLPAIAWWAIPMGILGWLVWDCRPNRYACLPILVLMTFPLTKGTSWAIEMVGNGNPAMWIAALAGLATRWPVFGPLVLIKPTLAPFAMIGIRRRSWWVGLLLFAAACLAFGAMWPDWLRVMGNARTDGPSWLYSLPNVTLVAIPLVAWAGRHRELIEAARYRPSGHISAA